MPARRKARSEVGNPAGSMICAAMPRQAQAQNGPGILGNVGLKEGDAEGHIGAWRGDSSSADGTSAGALCGIVGAVEATLALSRQGCQ
jgi:hypothetical protein